MMRQKRFYCHKIAGGTDEGELLLSDDDLCFYLVDPKTGEVLEKKHALEGRSIAGKVLAFPAGKGSSVVQADGLYQLQSHGTAPRAIIVRYPDTVLVACAIVMEIPMVDRVPEEFYRVVRNGDKVRVDADHNAVLLV